MHCQEITDYRLQKGVDESMHRQAMQKIGWNQSRYQNSLKENAPSVYQMEQNAMESSGNFESTLANAALGEEIGARSFEETRERNRWVFLAGLLK